MIETALYNKTSGKYIIKWDVIVKHLNQFTCYCDMQTSRRFIFNLHIHKLLYLVSIEYKPTEVNVLFILWPSDYIRFYIG